jgi:hypothetical protein
MLEMLQDDPPPREAPSDAQANVRYTHITIRATWPMYTSPLDSKYPMSWTSLLFGALCFQVRINLIK